jgi:hypothetical protein
MGEIISCSMLDLINISKGPRKENEYCVGGVRVLGFVHG